MTTSNGPHPDHDRGLEFDLSTLMSRRRTLGVLFGGAATAALAACTPSGTGSGTATDTASSGTTAAASPSASASSTVTRAFAECGVEIPQETAGPYPGDGSNGPNVLEASGVVRKDITTSFGTSSTKVDGVPLTVTLTLLDRSTSNGANGCAPLSGAAVYAWHCDRDGKYSLYDSGLENENYLRGVQETDGDGRVVFTSMFPACYSGRWPHVHFEVYASVEDATGGGEPIATSQLAFPADVCEAVYATDGYSQSVANLAQLSLDSDMVFADGAEQQLATMGGSVGEGYAASLPFAV